jgi:hypothetical protein
MSTSTEPGAFIWTRPPYYSYRTCGVWPNPYGTDEQDQQRLLHTVNGYKNEMYRRGYLDTMPKQNGVFGRSMRQAVIDFQIDEGLTVDGTIGKITGRRIAKDLVQLTQLEYGIPNNLLAGLFRLESAFDAGAQGLDRTRSTDRGWAQISDVHFAEITDQKAYGDLPFVTKFGAEQLTLSRPTTSSPPYAKMGRWDCAILHHNTPVGAKALFETGEYPTQRTAEYVWYVAVSANKPW